MWVLDNRELALLGWVVALLLIAPLAIPRTRKSLGSLAKQVFASKLTFVFGGMMLYTASLCYVAWQSGIWTAEQLPETVLWFFAGGFVLLMNTDKAGKGERFIRQAVLQAIGLSAAVEFVANTQPFPLLIEVILAPVLVTLGAAIAVVAHQGDEFIHVKRFLEGILVIVGLAFLLNSVWHAVVAQDDFFSLTRFRDFLVPILLTVCFVPFVYLFALWSMYEFTFLRINFLVKDKKIARYAKRKLVRTAGLRVRQLRPLAAGVMGPFFRSMTRTDVDDAIQKLTANRQEARTY
jgi:hypothetical protein